MVIQVATLAQSAQHAADLTDSQVTTWKPLSQGFVYLIDGVPAIQMRQNEHPGRSEQQRLRRDLQRIAHVERPLATVVDRDHFHPARARQGGVCSEWHGVVLSFTASNVCQPMSRRLKLPDEFQQINILLVFDVEKMVEQLMFFRLGTRARRILVGCSMGLPD